MARAANEIWNVIVHTDFDYGIGVWMDHLKSSVVGVLEESRASALVNASNYGDVISGL